MKTSRAAVCAVGESPRRRPRRAGRWSRPDLRLPGTGRGSAGPAPGARTARPACTPAEGAHPAQWPPRRPSPSRARRRRRHRPGSAGRRTASASSETLIAWTGMMRCANRAAERGVLERPVEEVGAERDDHLEVRRVGSGRRWSSFRGTTGAPLGEDMRVELLELVDHEQHGRSVTQPGHGVAKRQPTGAEGLDQPRRLPRSSTLARATASSSNGLVPGNMSVISHCSESGMAPDLRRGTSPARTTDDFPMPDGPTTTVRLPDPTRSTSSVDQRVPPEEVGGVRLAEGAQTLVRVAGVGERGERGDATARSRRQLVDDLTNRAGAGSCGSGAVAPAMTSLNEPPMCTVPPLPGLRRRRAGRR